MQNNLVALIKSLTEAKAKTSNAASRETKILDNVRVNNIPNPFHGLPNVKHSWIIANVLDPLLCTFHLAKKLAPEMSFDDLSWRTKAANRYLRIMHYRLVKHLSQKDAHSYWILALLLMKKSRVIRLVALRKLEPNWHLKMKFGHVLLLLRQYQNAINLLQKSLSITRTYAHKQLPDGTNTYRPLGNPHKAHRMYLYVWQCFFVMFLYSYIGKYQHGFLPGKGVTTAWERTKRIIKLPFVWEFDLKGAFPSLNVKYTCQRLKLLGTPAPIADFIRDMSLQTIERIPRQVQKLPETKTDLQEIAETGSATNPERYSGGAGMFLQFLGLHAAQAEETRKKFPNLPKAKIDPNVSQHFGLFMDNLGSKVDRIQKVLDSSDPNEFNPTIRGFPQGSGLSPILFDFAFEDGVIRHFNLFYGKDYEIVAYADDFIISSKRDLKGIFETSEILQSYGFQISKEKSRVLKVQGL